VCQALFELLRAGSRVVNVTSDWGCIFYVKNEAVRTQLLKPALTEAEISAAMSGYVRAAQAPTYRNDVYEAYMVGT